MTCNSRLVWRSFATAPFCFLALVALLASTARADLTPGGIQFNPAVSGFFPASYTSYAPGTTPPGYSTLVVSTTFPYAYTGSGNESYAGDVVSSVYKDASGQLAFSYVFNNLPVTSPPTSEITRATINDPSNPWAGVTIFQVGADSSGHSTPVSGLFGSWTNGNPFQIERDGADSAISATFNVSNSGTELLQPTSNLPGPDTSAVIWVTTNAKSFRQTDVGLIDNGTVGTGNAWAPNVPEPSTIVLVGLGVVAIAVAGRRRIC